jgi:hypothetical protein
MLDAITLRLARLRGRLPAESPGARGLERLARNPACTRLQALTLAGITPATASAEVYGQPAPEGQSPFALGAGNRFEQQLFDADAARLIALYQEAGRLGPGDMRVVMLDRVVPGKNRAAMDRRRELTRDLLRRKLAEAPEAPNVIIKARLGVPLLGTEYDTEPDVLVASTADAFYRPVEVKSYPDRAGKTDPADVRGACRQAAVAVVGLRHALSSLGIDEAAERERLAPDVADLVLRRPGSYFPTLRPMTLRGEVFSLQRALEGTGQALERVEALLAGLGEEATLDDPRVLDAIPASYVESCREHCALAAHCKDEAAGRGDPVLLGGQAREALAAAGSIQRGLDLMYGRAVPASAEERALAERLRESLAEYRRALS